MSEPSARRTVTSTGVTLYMYVHITLQIYSYMFVSIKVPRHTQTVDGKTLDYEQLGL